jgi:ubiquitin carboxyl-terminal hydrolase 8
LNVNWANPPPHVLSLEEEATREKQPLHFAARIEWSRYTKRDKSMITDFFAGQHASRLRCLACGHTSTTYEPWYNISVEIPPSGNANLLSCLSSYCKEERLQSGEEWRCPSCQNKKREATKRITLTRAPDNLVVNFKRFSASHRETARKIRTNVAFPLNNLDLGPFMLPEPSDVELRERGITPERQMLGPYLYNAYAVICHIGQSIGHGHYIAYVKDRSRSVWRCFNDERAEDYSEHDPRLQRVFQGDTPYIVFYERIPSGPQIKGLRGG